LGKTIFHIKFSPIPQTPLKFVGFNLFVKKTFLQKHKRVLARRDIVSLVDDYAFIFKGRKTGSNFEVHMAA
jgi:hypothetical protein